MSKRVTPKLKIKNTTICSSPDVFSISSEDSSISLGKA